MEYNRKIHITTEQFADLIGVPSSTLAGGIAYRGGPKALGRARVEGRQQSIYCRFEAVGWVDEQRTKGWLEAPKAKTPPREAIPLHKQGEYRPSAQMSINMARAGELYQHRLITPDCVGNEREFMHGHEKARLPR